MVDHVVEGGQTMNPSIEDLSEAIEKTHAKTVFVLPNNGNVILAAQQAAELCEDKRVLVVPTKNVAMGIAAAVAFQPEQTPEENAAHMNEAAQRVRTGSVTYAVRDISQDEIRSVHFNAASYDAMVKRYDPEKLKYGWNTLPDGEEIYFIPNPALGLWIDRTRF